MNTLIIDLDGTLLDTLDDLTAGLAPVLAARDLPALTRDQVRPLIGDGLAALLERALALSGAAPRPGDLDAFAAAYDRVCGLRTRPYDGAAGALDALAGAGWRLAICTNKPEAPARHLLVRLGLADRFAAICGGDTFPVRKPDPGHLLGTLDRAGAARDRAVAVGDLHHDLDAARAAAVPSIWAAWGYARTDLGARADATARAWREVPALAAALRP